MTFFGTCEVCGEAVVGYSGRTDRAPAFPVTGWEVPREQGGTNHIRGRVRVPNRVRHVGCLSVDESRDVQESLL